MEKSNLVARMNQNEFLVVAQLHPPKREQFAKFSTVVSLLEENGITIFDINASKTSSRLRSYEVASRLANSGREMIVHVTAREGLEQTLAAVSEGYRSSIRHVLVIKGDPPQAIEGVQQYTVTTKDLMESLENLRRTRQMDLSIAAAVDQNSGNKKAVEEKRARGADFFMSQPVFDIAQARQLQDFYSSTSDKPLVAGIWPVTNQKVLETIHVGKIPGVLMPNTVYEEGMSLSDERLKAWSFARTKQLVQTIKEERLAQGVYLVAPINNPVELVDFVKEL